MSSSHLRACPACARHVRVSEQSCPFCARVLDAAFRASPAPEPPRARLTRAALFAFGTGALAAGTVAAAAPGCTTDTTIPVYGAAAIDAEADSLQPIQNADGGDAGDARMPNNEDSGDAGDARMPNNEDSGDALALTDAAYGASPTPPGNDDAGDAQPVELLDAAYGAFPVDGGTD